MLTTICGSRMYLLRTLLTSFWVFSADHPDSWTRPPSGTCMSPSQSTRTGLLASSLNSGPEISSWSSGPSRYVERTWLPHFAFSASGSVGNGTCAAAPPIRKKTAAPAGTTLETIINRTARIHRELARPAKPARVFRSQPGDVPALLSCVFMTAVLISPHGDRFSAFSLSWRLARLWTDAPWKLSLDRLFRTQASDSVLSAFNKPGT